MFGFSGTGGVVTGMVVSGIVVFGVSHSLIVVSHFAKAIVTVFPEAALY